MNAAVDDTVDTMECDGDGEEDRKGEAGDGVGSSRRFTNHSARVHHVPVEMGGSDDGVADGKEEGSWAASLEDHLVLR